jgi:hypothetical protein
MNRSRLDMKTAMDSTPTISAVRRAPAPSWPAGGLAGGAAEGLAAAAGRDELTGILQE